MLPAEKTRRMRVDLLVLIASMIKGATCASAIVCLKQFASLCMQAR